MSKNQRNPAARVFFSRADLIDVGEGLAVTTVAEAERIGIVERVEIPTAKRRYGTDTVWMRTLPTPALERFWYPRWKGASRRLDHPWP